MKKIFISFIAVMLMAFSANAQVWVGGSVNYAGTKATVKGDGFKEVSKTSTFTLAPEVGFTVNDKLAVACGLGLVTGGDEDVTFTLQPYGRYNFYKSGNVSLFADGGLNLTYNDDEWTPAVFVAPGISYTLNDKLSAVTRLGGVTYSWKTEKYDGVRYTASSFGAGLNLLVATVGLYYSF